MVYHLIEEIADESWEVEISYWQYIKMGVPITLAAIVLSVLTLNLEYALYLWVREAGCP